MSGRLRKSALRTLVGTSMLFAPGANHGSGGLVNHGLGTCENPNSIQGFKGQIGHSVEGILKDCASLPRADCQRLGVQSGEVFAGRQAPWHIDFWDLVQGRRLGFRVPHHSLPLLGQSHMFHLSVKEVVLLCQDFKVFVE